MIVCGISRPQVRVGQNETLPEMEALPIANLNPGTLGSERQRIMVRFTHEKTWLRKWPTRTLKCYHSETTKILVAVVSLRKVSYGYCGARRIEGRRGKLYIIAFDIL